MATIQHDAHNAEPPTASLTSSVLTAVDVIFHRNHGDTLTLNAHTHRLAVLVEDDARSLMMKQGCRLAEPPVPSTLSMQDLQSRFARRKAVVALECAGNRRSEMNEERKTEGIAWRAGVIANIEWQGCLLRDVLLSIGIPDPFISSSSSPAEWTKGLHVQFESAQKCSDSDWYGASIPLAAAMRPDLPVLLADTHNFRPLTPQHGYPLRVVVPGHIGARSVKWVSRILVSTQASPNFYTRLDYKVLLPKEGQVERDVKELGDDDEYRAKRLDEIDPLMEMGVGGAICEPVEDEEVRVEERNGEKVVHCNGYAIGESGSAISHVHVLAVPCEPSNTAEDLKSLASVAPPNTWTQASLHGQDSTTAYAGKQWGWTLWDAAVPVPVPSSAFALIMRAETESGVQQPRTSAWNVRGVETRGWSVAKGLRAS